MIDRDETIELLQIASAYDSRRIDELMIFAWLESARRGGWTFVDARDAVQAHYANATAWIMPGHVTERIRAARRQPGAITDVLKLGTAPASPEKRAEVMQMVADLANTKTVRAALDDE